jgi:predicted RND superfamily exporter protein
MRKRFESWFKAVAGVIYDSPWIFVFITVLVAVGLGMQVSRLRINTSNESYFHPTDPVLTVYDDFKKQFGTDELIVVAVEAPDVFRQSFLRRLEQLHKELAENVPHLADITSLVNARNTRGEGESLIVEDFLENFPQNNAELEALKERAMSNPLYINRLISPDATMTTIIIETELADTQAPDDVLAGFGDESAGEKTVKKQPGRTKNEIAEVVVNTVQEITDKYDSKGFHIQLAGVPVVLKVHKEALMKDTSRFLLLAILTIGICLFFMFRRFSGVFLPLLVVILSLFSTLGLMGLFDVSFTPPSMILPSFLLAVGVGAAIHILALVFRQLDRGEDRRGAIVFALGHSGIAVVITSLTTSIGLASFATTALAPVAALGIFGGIGVLLSLFYTILLIPALLAILPLKRKAAKSSSDHSHDRFDRLMDRITELVSRRPKIITAVTILLAIVGLGSALQLHLSHHVLHWQPASWACRQATETIDKVMGGTINIEILVDTGRENGLYDPVVLKNLDRLAGELKAYDDGMVKVANASSVSDVIKEIHQALNENRPSFYKVPGNADLVPQEFLLFENSGSDDLEKVIDSSFRLARFSIQVPWLDVFYYVPLLQKIQSSFQAAFADRATVTVTGLLQLFVHTVKAAAMSMAQGYVTAAVLITLMMILMVGGLRTGLVSMIPNLAPVIFVMGLMYWLGLPLDTFTMMIGTIALGLAVDDTVHFLNGFRGYFNDGLDAKEAIRSTLYTSGRAMLITTVVLALGFFMFTFAAMLNEKRFGALTGLTLVLALVAAFLSAPSLMTLMFSGKQSNIRHVKGDLA